MFKNAWHFKTNFWTDQFVWNYEEMDNFGIFFLGLSLSINDLPKVPTRQALLPIVTHNCEYICSDWIKYSGQNVVHRRRKY